MTPQKFLSLFSMSQQEYLDLFPPMTYQVRTQDDGSTAIIDIVGYIGRDIIREWITGEKSPNTVNNLKGQLREISSEKIIVNINSYGGDLNAGIVIKDMLQSKRAEIITNTQGFSASAATVIAQAGSTRRMPETSFQLLHRAMVGLLGYYNQNTFRSVTGDLEVIDNSLIAMYTKRSKASSQEITDLMDEGEGYGRWISAEEALKMGLIDEIYDPADEKDPNTDHLEGDERDPEGMVNVETLKKMIAFNSNVGIDQLLAGIGSGPSGDESEQELQDEATTAEEARSRKIKNEMFIKSNEVI